MLNTVIGRVFLTGLFFIMLGAANAQLNVKDFGAKGDGKTDDTEAIRKAIDSVHRTGGKVMWAAYMSSSELFFPQGAYLISDTISVNDISEIHGEGKAVIRQIDDTKDIFSGSGLHRILIEGLTFVKGRDQISIGNADTDMGNLKIENCHFMGAAGAAIRIGDRSASSLVTIQGCVFALCRQVLIATSDITVFKDSWITTDPEMENMAVIENYGILQMNNILGVPLTGKTDQRWIDNYGLKIFCDNVRFGGENGGFTPIINFSKYRSASYPLVQIVLNNCLLYSLSNNKRNCAVYCEEIPNQIAISTSEFISTPILFNERINLDNYFIDVPRERLGYSVENCIGGKPFILPEGLRDIHIRKSKYKGLSDEELRKHMAEAKQYIASLPKEKHSPLVGKDGHYQRTTKGDYIDITPDKYNWTLDTLMDGRTETNADFLAFEQVGNSVIIMRRLPTGINIAPCTCGALDRVKQTEKWPRVQCMICKDITTPIEGNCPNILIKDVEIDLNTYPVLSLKLRDIGKYNPIWMEIKIIDKETGEQVHPKLRTSRPWYEYYTFDIVKMFNYKEPVKNKRFDIKIYYIALENLVGRVQLFSDVGDYILLDFLRFEKR